MFWIMSKITEGKTMKGIYWENCWKVRWCVKRFCSDVKEKQGKYNEMMQGLMNDWVEWRDYKLAESIKNIRPEFMQYGIS